MPQSLYELAAAGKIAHNAEVGKGLIKPHKPSVLQRKLDGWRLIAYVGADKVTMFSRSGKTYSGRLPHVEAELLAAFPPDTVLDGEAVAYRLGEAGSPGEGKIFNDWHVAQSVLTTHGKHPAAAKVTYTLFDLIAHGGIDARPLGYGKRLMLLEQIFNGAGFKSVTLIESAEPTDANHELFVAQGFEGSMLKALDARYRSDKRGFGQTKYKPQTTIEAVIMGFKPGQEGWTGMVGAIIFGQYDKCPDCAGYGGDLFAEAAGAPAKLCLKCGGGGAVLVERGRCSGMDMRTRLRMTSQPEKWLGTVVEIAHMGVNIGATESGRFRSPQCKRPRPDRAPLSVVLHDA